MAEGLEEAIQEDLGVAFFVTSNVVASPVNERCELVLAGHGRVVQDNGAGVSKEDFGTLAIAGGARSASGAIPQAGRR
jgi:hypothetical protein